MRNKNRSNILLVEILMAVLFFMLSATVIAQVFAASRNMTKKAGAETMALAQAQNVAESVYGQEDMDAVLTQLGFLQSHGTWTKDYGDFSLYVTGSFRPTDAGELFEGEVRAFYKTRDVKAARAADEELFSLPCTWYREVEV